MAPTDGAGFEAAVSASPGTPSPADAPDSGGVFFLRVNFVLFMQVLTALLALGVNVVVFRELGADGKGHYSLFALATTIGSGASTLGVGLANIYFIGRGRYSLPALLAGSEFLVGAATLAGAAVIGALSLAGLAGDISRDPPLWLYALSVPLALQLAHLAPVLQARHQFGALNLAAAFIPGGTLAGVAVLQAFDDLTVGRALTLWVGSYGVANLIAMTAVGWRVFAQAFPFRPPADVLRAQIRFGLQGELGNLLQLMNYRFDLFVVAAYQNAAAAGFYSVAVAVAESLWLISGAMMVVLTPRLTSAGDDEAAEFAPFICRTVLLLNGVLALGVAAAAPVLIEAVFGGDAERSVAPALWLLPGVVAMSGGLMLSSYVFSRGRPILNTYSTAATVLVTLALDLVLIPPFGIEGAAVASSTAYTATFGLSLFWYRRLSGRSVWTALIVRPEDARTYVSVARAASSRVRHAMARGA